MSKIGDMFSNGGRCERCNEPGSENRPQVGRQVFCGGGVGYVTMWICSKCIAAEKAKEEKDG